MTAPTLRAISGLAAERLPGAVNGFLYGGELALGCSEQILSLAPSRDGEFGIAAHDQALVGEVGRRDAGEIRARRTARVERRRHSSRALIAGARSAVSSRASPA